MTHCGGPLQRHLERKIVSQRVDLAVAVVLNLPIENSRYKFQQRERGTIFSQQIKPLLKHTLELKRKVMRDLYEPSDDGCYGNSNLFTSYFLGFLLARLP